MYSYLDAGFERIKQQIQMMVWLIMQRYEHSSRKFRSPNLKFYIYFIRRLQPTDSVENTILTR